MDGILSLLGLSADQLKTIGDARLPLADTTAFGPATVTAGAGSGKTRTLVARYLRLLEQDVPVRAVAAVTFTEKAGREMRTRIRERMEEWIAHCGGAERARWQALAAELDAARIGTIHSLCAAILRGHPAEARLDPMFEVLDENDAATRRANAVESALAWAAGDEQASALFTTISVAGARDLVDAMLRQRTDTQEALAGEADPLTIWSGAIREWLTAVFASDDWKHSLATLAGVSAHNKADRLEAERRELLDAWLAVKRATPHSDWAAALAALRTMRTCMNAGFGQAANWNRPDLNAAKDALRTLAAAYDTSIAPVAGKADAVEWSADRRAAELTTLLTALFERAEEEYRALKGEALDFEDLEALTVRLLTGDAGVRARWQSELRAVLVDEFQDTNARQKQIVYALTGFNPRRAQGGHGLFIVGDAKQSIYRFRGADVSVFQTVQADVSHAGHPPIALAVTYRAHAPLVDALNGLLQPVMEPPELAGSAAGVPFAELVPWRLKPREGVRRPFIELLLGAGENADEGRRAAAAALAERLAALHRREGFEWQQMALLFRASTNFDEYEGALERFGIPFVTVAGRGFYDRPEVRDLLNALHAVADPSDDLALAGLLRSPACALTDAALMQLRLDGRGRPRSLRSALEAERFLDGEDATRAGRAARLIAELHEIAGRVTVAVVLKQFLDRTGYRAMLAGATGGERALRNVDKLLADAHRSRRVGVSAFLDYVAALKDAAAREGEAPVEAGGAVQLMTIHKAKGLEFPLVVMADAGWHAGSQKPAYLFDAELGFVPHVGGHGNPEALAYALASMRDGLKSKAEDRRLLYVAATRAQEKLLVSGHVAIHSGKRSLPGWLKLIGDAYGIEADALNTPLSAAKQVWSSAHAECSLSPLNDREPKTARAAASTMYAGAFPLLPAIPKAESSIAAAPPERVWRVVARPVVPARVVGTLAHAALRYWRFPDDADFAALLEPHAYAAGLVESQLIKRAVRDAGRLLARFQRHALYGKLDTSDRYHEVPFNTSASQNGVIDLLSRYDDRWHVVEFKTDEVRHATHLARLIDEQYAPQVRRYVGAARALLGSDVMGMLVFINVNGRIEVHDINGEAA